MDVSQMELTIFIMVGEDELLIGKLQNFFFFLAQISVWHVTKFVILFFFHFP